jgi:hypothetical protein
MAPPSRAASGQFRDARRRRTRVARRARRLAGVLVLLIGVLVTLLLSAFGSSSTGVGARSLSPANAVLPAGPPKPQVIAAAGNVRLWLPISQQRITAIGYHSTGDAAVELRPYGRLANEGLVTRVMRSFFGGGGSGLPYYHLGGGGDGPSTAAVDVGAAAGTDVYSPVDGTVVAISDYVINGDRTHFGSRIEIQPAGEPSLVVALTRLRPDPALTIGSAVAAYRSKVGTLLDFSAVERQSLAGVTHEAGNHVTVSGYPAATGSPR